MWSKMASGYWTYQDDQGVALVESLRDGTWRWEGHAIGPCVCPACQRETEAT